MARSAAAVASAIVQSARCRWYCCHVVESLLAPGFMWAGFFADGYGLSGESMRRAASHPVAARPWAAVCRAMPMPAFPSRKPDPAEGPGSTHRAQTFGKERAGVRG